MVKPPALGTSGQNVSSHWPGRNCPEGVRGKRVSLGKGFRGREEEGGGGERETGNEL